ncbi:MAG: V-type ATP synthase subunit E [Bacilli bacterium]|nr:V-type ATP synthase subunit E [Bacilli bacterium]
MQNIEQVILYMKDEIEREAQLEEKAILEEVKALEKEAYESMRIEAKKDADLRLKQELEEMESNAAIEISESHIERTKKLIEKRDEYVSTIFKSAKDKLIDFTNSKDYQDFMMNKAKKIVDMFDMAECIVYVSSKDIAFKDQLMKLYSNILDVKEDKNIIIGGLIGENVKSLLTIDETLDFALKNQKEWFTKNSGLTIK